MATYTDDFNRTHGSDLGANWTLQQGALIIHTNRAHGNGGGHASSFYSGASFPPNQSSQVTVDTGSPDFAGVGVRMSGTGGSVRNYTHISSSLTIVGTPCNVFKTVDGIRSALAFHGLSFVPGDTIGISISGAVISYYKNGAVIGTVTDGQLTTGAPGIAFFNNDSASDNWIGSTTDTASPLPIAPPPAPITPCDPQTQVNNGGKGNAGCNPGGVGWETSYDGAYGTVPQHADPTDGETLTDKEDFDVWVEVDVISYPSLSSTTYRRAIAEISPPDLNTYYGGRKPSGLLAIGDLEHGLGNEQGGFEAASVDIDFSDTIDRLFRTLLADQDLDGNEVRIYAASPAGRAAATPARLLFRGVLQRSALNAPLVARLSAVDALFADGAPFGPDRQWPPLIPRFVNVANTTADTLETALPVLYGEKSDEGATAPATNEVNPKGLVPLILLGQTTLDDGDSPEPGVYEQDSEIPRAELVTITNILPSGGRDGFHDTVYIWFAALRVSDGKIGPFALNPHTGTEVVYELNPAGEEDEGGHWPHLHFKFINDEPNPAYNYIGFASTIPTYHPISNPNPGGQRGIAIHDGVTADSFYERDDGRDASLQIPPEDPAVVLPDNTWDAYLITWGAAYRVITLYGSNLGGGAEDAKHDRVELDMDALSGSSILLPWAADGSVSPNWPYADTFVDWTAEDGTLYRLTVMLARGPISDDHKNGVVNFAVNMIGIEDVGDGTGLPIMEAHVAQQHWLENFVLNRWTSGAWATAGTAPKWSDGTFKVRSSRFTSRQAYTAQAIGDAGLLVNWYVAEAQGLLAHVEEWNYSTETKLGVNGHGQLTLGFLDDRIDPATWTHVQHIRDIYGQVSTTFGDNRENFVRGICDYDPDADRFRSAVQEFKSTVGYAKYKNRWKGRADPLQSSILGYSEHFAWVLQQRLDRLQTGEINVTIDGPTGWLDTDVDVPGILLTTIEGRGANGYEAKQMWLRRRRWSLASRLTTYSLQDISDIPLGLRFRSVTTEGVGITESLSVRMNPQPVSLAEGVHVTEALTTKMNPQPVPVGNEAVRIGEFLSVVRI